MPRPYPRVLELCPRAAFTPQFIFPGCRILLSNGFFLFFFYFPSNISIYYRSPLETTSKVASELVSRGMRLSFRDFW